MGLPKRKTNIKVFGVNQNTDGSAITGRRKELLEDIIKSDTYLPDSILHDDLDLGMLDFVKENFKVNSDGDQIPVIPKILTIQRWGEYTNNWSFSDDDGNIKLPFIAVVRKPDVQLGTNPSIQRTIPDRREFFYASVPTWDGNQMGADIYKIPQPIAVDISFDVTIVCTKFRDINKFNQKVLQKFSSRQAYTRVKGHYIPIVMDRIEDNTPMDTLDGRRFYIQNYSFTMLGFLIDDEEFEVSPAIARSILMAEVDTRTTKLSKKSNPITINSNYSSGSIVANYSATSQFKVDKTTKISFNDVLDKSNGDTIIIPVDIFIETNQISGTTQYTVNDVYSGLSYSNVFSGVTIDSIGKTKYNFTYEYASTFEPIITPTPTASVIPSVTPSVTPSITPTPSVTSSITPTPSVTPSVTSSVIPSVTPTSSVTPSITPTPSVTVSITPTSSVAPTTTPSVTPSVTSSITPSITPTPSITSSVTPTPSITSSVTPTPSVTPSVTPTPIASVMPDDKLLVTGGFGIYNGSVYNDIVKLNSDGSVDNTFSGGTGFNTFLENHVVYNNKIYGVGYFTSYSGSTSNYIIRLNLDGSIDNTFSIGTGFNNITKCVVPQPDGKLLVGGFFTSYNGTSASRIARLNSDGTIDNTFSGSTSTTLSSTVYDISLQSDGKMILCGVMTLKRIERLNSDKSYDSSFDTTIGVGFNALTYMSSIQSDGKIVVGGDFTTFSGVTSNRIIRLNSSGTIDNTFSIGTGFNNGVYFVLALSNGKIMVGGNFTSYNGTSVNRIVRLNSDGTIDNTFSIGSGFDNQVLSIYVQTNGKILVSGNFTSYNGTSVKNIVRLLSDGTLDTTLNTGTGFGSGATVTTITPIS